MNFATWSIRNPVPAILFFVIMTFAGIYGFKHLPIQLFPDVDIPLVNVNLVMPGSTSEDLESEVGRKVEDAISTLSSVKHIYTTISGGTVRITTEFYMDKPLSTAVLEVREAVDRIRTNLPENLQPPNVSAVHIGSTPLITYAVTSPSLSEENLSWLVDKAINREVLSVHGVGVFERIGGVDREMRVEIDPLKLAAFNLTITDVSRALHASQIEGSGGRGQIGQQELLVRTSQAIQTLSDLQDIPISVSNQRIARLSQVATVTDGASDRTQQTLLDGKPAVGFRIYRASGYDETKVATDMAHTIAHLAQEHPEISITPIFSTVDYTLKQYRSSMDMLYEGAILAVLIVWLFLKDWRATFISAVALPLSIIPTYAIIYWLGFSLNMLTLLALAVVVGILVDDAIVEVENIIRHAENGSSIKKASMEAVNEIAVAVIATTLALVSIFLPTAFMTGTTGQFFKQFGWTIVISVMTSLLVARLVTPFMAAYFLKQHPQSRRHASRSSNGLYMAGVDFCLKHRAASVAVAGIILVIAILAASTVPTGFMPSSDKGYTNVNFELPPEASMADTLRVVEQARTQLEGISGIAHVFTTIGASEFISPSEPPTPAGINMARLTVVFAPKVSKPQSEIESEIMANLSDIAGVHMSMNTGGFGEQLSLQLGGDNTQALVETAKALTQEMHHFSEFKNIRSSANFLQKEIVVTPDVTRAADMGVSSQDISDTVRIATNGDFSALLAKVNLDDRQINIRARMPAHFREDPQSINALRLHGKSGLVPLATMATISLKDSMSRIERYDRKRFIRISADLNGAPLGEMLEHIKALPALKNRPASVQLFDTGDAETMTELKSNFEIAIAAGVLCILSVLILLFHDLFRPVTILSILPLALSGAIAAIVVTRQQLNLPVGIGIIMLLGIVTKNSILLVEFAVKNMRENNMDKTSAIRDACVKRARPIMMTTAAMVMGMLPVALGFAEDSKFRQPMAITVIGGLLFSTALTLFVIPAIFSFAEDLSSAVKSYFRAAPADEGAD